MNPLKCGIIMLTVAISAISTYAETIALQEGVAGYSGCTDSYLSRNAVYADQIYGPFGAEDNIVIQGGT